MMGGRTKPRRVPAQSEGDWHLVNQTQGGGGPNPFVSVSPARARLTLQVPALIHVTPRAPSSLSGMKTETPISCKDLFHSRGPVWGGGTALH